MVSSGKSFRWKTFGVPWFLVLTAALAVAVFLAPSSGVSAQEDEEDSGSVEGDRKALTALYHATGGEEWTYLPAKNSWTTELPLVAWAGVWLTPEGRADIMWLNEFGLKGELPDELDDLTKLAWLIINGNPGLTGEIPASIGNMSELTRVRLYANSLTGEIPASLGRLHKLKELDLSHNDLSGQIPLELGELPELKGLRLNNNWGLTGCIPHRLREVTFGVSWLPVCSPDRDALFALHKATGGPDWNNDDNWLSPLPIGEWHGVTVDNQNRVVKLNLTYNGLSGELPAALGDLSHLEELYLFHNDLSGAIPPELGQLARLKHLSLGGNDFSGELPAELGDLASLESLWVGGSGYSPATVASVSGAIPPELGRLSNLKFLKLANTRLSGEIPSELGQLSNMDRMSLAYNQLTGEIPTELGDLTRLRLLDVYGNTGLTGCVPDGLRGTPVYRNGLPYCEVRTARPHEPDWAGLVALYDATDGANWRFNRNWMSGAPIADWYGVVTDESGRVVELLLHENRLNGEIPAALSSLTSLRLLFLAENDLTGEIPAELGGLTNLLQLWAGDNRLSGEIPAELGGLSNLSDLELYGNELSGELPAELGNLSGLRLLALAGNNLSGEIPAELGQLSSLLSLGLSGNNLSGEIPAELGNLSRLWILYLSGNDGLTGCIPESVGSQAYRALRMDNHGLPHCP